MTCTLQYPKKTPYEVREEMDRIEHDSKPLTSCQINGIDWEKRLSNRQKRRERDMKKKADAYKDFFQSAIIGNGLDALAQRTGMNKYVGNIGTTANDTGTLLGIFGGSAPTLEEVAKQENDYYGYIPGNAARRLMLRRRMVNRELKGNPSVIYGEHFGRNTSTLLATLGLAGLGALIGSQTGNNSDERRFGAGVGGILGGVGGLLGSAIGHGIGFASAGLTRPRSNKEQQEYERTGSWANWLVPGAGIYNEYKSLGVSNRMVKEYLEKQQKKKDKETEKDADMIKKSFNKTATPESIKADPALATVFALGATGYLGYKIYNLLKDRGKSKRELKEETMKMAKAASHIMIKRSAPEGTSTADIIKHMQDQVANNYIASLKKERDRTVKDDLLRGALSGGVNGAQYGLLSGLLFGTTVAPAKDLIRGSDRTVLQSFGRGAGLGGLSGMGAGALIGSAVGALNNWATRERRRDNAIAKLKELGITD